MSPVASPLSASSTEKSTDSTHTTSISSTPQERKELVSPPSTSTPSTTPRLALGCRKGSRGAKDGMVGRVGKEGGKKPEGSFSLSLFLSLSFSTGFMKVRNGLGMFLMPGMLMLGKRLFLSASSGTSRRNSGDSSSSSSSFSAFLMKGGGCRFSKFFSSALTNSGLGGRKFIFAYLAMGTGDWWGASLLSRRSSIQAMWSFEALPGAIVR
ncbi:hypothetical protein B484DRAFT_459551 [Ochromonadaceae sp. CCMP2298]|nr:hypothetical protein B484DRAFT_459551 [Ochromonadaceae sp. CCMP2298]|mmetsp:Transcript_20104/g.44695  ORF Transcript_20104/g.44695 Transcript_20104/m.44695 type:complete len:210 (-) Transcript_20104:14-643(-)